MSTNSLPTVTLWRVTDERLTTEAYRRCGPGEDVRDVKRRIVERALAAVLGQLEAEDVGPHGRHCRCGTCATPRRFAEGTAPGTVTVESMSCRGTDRSCSTHDRPTVHRGLGPVCPVSGRRPEPER